MIKVAAALCIIHNICEVRNEPCFEEWLQQGFDDDVTAADVPGTEDQAGSDVRNMFAAYFMTPEGQITGAF